MARTTGKRNVVIVTTQVDGTWRGRGVEVQTDGTLVLGTAKTSTGEKGDLLKQLIAPFAAGGTTPEDSALYSPHEIHTVVHVAPSQAV